MTKRVNWLPNERVDVPDMNGGTNDLSSGIINQHVERLLIDHFARVSSGFRVEIANQGTSPGQFTVYNGVAFDRNGQILQNEDEENTSRSLTLSADGQYYLEVLFLLNASDTDARGFWDPTVDNGTDPSGDSRLPGREFSQNVSTRLSPDWQLVTPVSTTGFEINTNPNSLKVPVAVIQVVGGVITGATTVPAQTVLEYDTLVGATVIRGLDTRLFPDAFAATLGGTPIGVTANDRRNGVLTLAIGLGAAHQAGERIIRTGGGLNQFLLDRDNPALPTIGSVDGRPRFFQGFEDRGKALSSNPNSTVAPTDVSDTTLQDLKDYVDFLAAQLRELKFGAARSSEVGKIAPPMAFVNPPRYYHHSGGVQGARTATITIGNGVDTFGDMNVAQLGTIEATLTAALAALPANGGHIHIKAAATPYDFATGLTIATSCLITGDGNGTILRATGANPAITVNADVTFQNLRVNRQAAATALYAMSCTNGTHRISMLDCYVEGFDLSGTDCIFTGTTFTATAGGTNPLRIGNAGFSQNLRFSQCTFTIPSANMNALATASVNQVRGLFVTDCAFTGLPVANSGKGLYLANVIGAVVENNRILDFGYGVYCDTTLNYDVDVSHNTITHTTTNTGRIGIHGSEGLDGFFFNDNFIKGLNDPTDGYIIGISLADTTIHGTVNNNNIQDLGTGAAALASHAVGLLVGSTSGGTAIRLVTISGNTFQRMDSAAAFIAAGVLQFGSCIDCTVTDNKFYAIGDQFATNKDWVGGWTNGGARASALIGFVFSNNVIRGLGNGSCSQTVGFHIDVGGTGATLAQITISGNSVISLTTTGGFALAIGIGLQGGGRQLTVSNNVIENLTFCFSAGIVISDNAAQPVEAVTVVGNTLGEGAGGTQFLIGIQVAPSNVTSQTFNISNNVINGYSFIGLYVFGNGATENVCIVGNNLQTFANNASDGISVSGCQILTISGNTLNNIYGGAVTGKRNVVVSSCYYTVFSNNVCKRFGGTDAAFPGTSANVLFNSCVRVIAIGNMLVENVPGGPPCIGFLNYAATFVYYTGNMFTHPFGAASYIANYGAVSDIDGRAFNSSGLYPAVPVSFATIGLNWFE